MKYLKVVCFSLLFIGIMLPASIVLAANQPENEVITVKKSDLPADMVKRLDEQQKVEDLAKKVSTYGKWVGAGKEIGIAINDSLSAITTQADNFSKTGVGRFTMWIVAYKVLGKDLIGVIVGVPLLIAWIYTSVWLIRKNLMTISILKTEDKDGTKHYEVIERESDTEKLFFIVGIFGAVIVGWIIVGGLII